MTEYDRIKRLVTTVTSPEQKSLVLRWLQMVVLAFAVLSCGP